MAHAGGLSVKNLEKETDFMEKEGDDSSKREHKVSTDVENGEESMC